MTRSIDWGMSPGMGDVMHALNCAHFWSKENKEHLILNLHWEHGIDYLHHCEETETIIERCDYINSLYLKSDVTINHITNSKLGKFTGDSRYDWMDVRRRRLCNTWVFDPRVKLPTDENKVVMWRATFNANIPRYWKRAVTNEQWNLIIDALTELGYNVVELCYRTPIREATYHINTCNFVFCYDGMWHYIAANFHKPMFVTTLDKITQYHTPTALDLQTQTFVKYLYNLHTPIDKGNELIKPIDWAHRRAKNKKEHWWKWYNGN